MGRRRLGGGYLCHCLCGFGMGATCIATIWKRSHLGELGDSLTFPLHLEEGSLQSRGGDMKFEDSHPPNCIASAAYHCGWEDWGGLWLAEGVRVSMGAPILLPMGVEWVRAVWGL